MKGSFFNRLTKDKNVHSAASVLKDQNLDIIKRNKLVRKLFTNRILVFEIHEGRSEVHNQRHGKRH